VQVGPGADATFTAFHPKEAFDLEVYVATKALDDLRALSQAVDKGEYLQQASKWQRKLWVRSSPLVYKGKGKQRVEKGKGLERFSELSSFIDEQPNAISRADVFTHMQGARDDPKGLELGFVLAMMWGFGLTRYGPPRTSVMLESAGSEFGSQLSEVVELLNRKARSDEDVADAYKKLLKLEQCGPAFATKFMYFASPETARIPIFDSQVVAWLGSEGRKDSTKYGGRLSAGNPHHFFEYYKFCAEASQQLGITDIGLLEYLMFIDQNAARLVSDIESLPKWMQKRLAIDYLETLIR